MKIRQGKSSQPQYRSSGKILWWGDSPTSTTGFGVVAKNILKPLRNLEVDIVGINFSGVFPDKKEFPYNIIPATMGNKEDPYGNALLLHSLKQKKYDLLFVLNDTPVVHPVAVHIQKMREQIMGLGAEPFKIVYYFPVDCRILDNWTGMLDIADIKVAYNQYGYDEAAKKGKTPDFIINHGVDNKAFHKIPDDVRRKVRGEVFKIKDDNTFLWINVNRNSLRKNISQTLLAFSRFHQKYPNSKLYLHTSVIDGKAAGGIDIDLQVPCRELGLKVGRDVMFPEGYIAVKGIPEPLLNQCYNAADGFITTTAGEGWGCSAVEAMAAEIPVVVPNNTSHPEILGANKVRGYMYDCKELTLFDSSGFRNTAHTDDVVNSMLECYEERWTSRQAQIIKRAREYTEKIDWSNINKQWAKVFSLAFNKQRLQEYRAARSKPEEV